MLLSVWLIGDCILFNLNVFLSIVLELYFARKAGKASGLDNIPPRLLKDSVDVIAGPLPGIINTSLRQGIVSSDWKCALFKKGKRDDMDKYRPISISPAVSKVLKRVVHLQLSRYLKEHHLLSHYQFGFRKFHSTETAVVSFNDTIRMNIGQGMLTGAVFIDLCKAFNSVGQCYL